MGCVGSKQEQEALGKETAGDNQESQALAAHYVKDPTAAIAGTKAVSNEAERS